MIAIRNGHNDHNGKQHMPYLEFDITNKTCQKTNTILCFNLKISLTSPLVFYMFELTIIKYDKKTTKIDTFQS